MNPETKLDELIKKRVVYEIPGMADVNVREVEYRRTEFGALTMSLYAPCESKDKARRPVIVFVFGFADPMFGQRLKDIGQYVSWGQMLAVSGFVAVTYTYQEPIADLQAVLQYLKQNAEALGIDENRIGLWACSGNVPIALSILMREKHDFFKCAVLCYGYMLDLKNSTGVAAAAAQFGFVNPCAGKSVADLPRDLPLFLIRAGQESMPNLNESIDLFLAEAVAHNLPITFANYAAAPHAFDLFDDSETSREMIEGILGFLQFHLVALDCASTLLT